MPTEPYCRKLPLDTTPWPRDTARAISSFRGSSWSLCHCVRFQLTAAHDYKLADGTTAFEDELPKGARVTGSQIVTTRDGEILGLYRHDARLLKKLRRACMAERYGTARQRRRSDGFSDKDPAQPSGIAGKPRRWELMQAVERLHATIPSADVIPNSRSPGLVPRNRFAAHSLRGETVEIERRRDVERYARLKRQSV
jgi:hypothetical protein